MQEDFFALAYYVKGLNLHDIKTMPTKQRRWWVNRMVEQKEREAKAAEGK